MVGPLGRVVWGMTSVGSLLSGIILLSVPVV